MRSFCGSNDHPDSVMFLQVFRLLCCYSLGKPPKGANVTGTELLETLVTANDAVGGPRKQWFSTLDTMVEFGSRTGELNEQNGPSVETIVSDECDRVSSQGSRHSHLLNHDYDVIQTSGAVQTYVTGFVARRIIRLTKCCLCIDTLKNNDPSERNKVIDLMNRFGGLIHSSDKLIHLIEILERIVLEIVGKLTVKINTPPNSAGRVRIDIVKECWM